MRTVCRVLQEIIDTAHYSTDDIILLEKLYDIRIKAVEASYMAKKMDRKLRAYKTDYDKGMWK